MLSRVADSIYWISRYIERAENAARMVDVNLTMTLDLPHAYESQWAPVVHITGDAELFAERYGKPDEETAIRFLAFDPEYPNSILSCLRRARENAREIRDSIPSEMWEQINSFYHQVTHAASDNRIFDAPHAFFDAVRRASHLFVGVVHAIYTHEEGYHFSRMGRLIERADQTSRILDVKYFVLLPTVSLVGSSYDTIQWSAVLKSISGHEMYRKEHGRIDFESIVEFLVLNKEFPRSILFCLLRAEQSLHAITGTPPGAFRNAAEQRLGQLQAELAFSTSSEIIQDGLHEFLDGFQAKLNRVDQAVFDTFFALRPMTKVGVVG